MEKKSLEQMIPDFAYDEIKNKVDDLFGEKTAKFLFPAIKQALEEGDREVRENILVNWLDVDSLRVCTHCGAIMHEGWYLDSEGYACSDECCQKLMNISKEEYDRYKIYLPEIKAYLEDEGKYRQPDDLTEEEIDDICEGIVEKLDAYYYTEWY